MGASKEAYSLFGPEVKFSDSGEMWCLHIVSKAPKFKFQGSFIHVADFSGPTALGLYLQQLKNDSVTFYKITILLIRYPLLLHENDVITYF